MDFRKYIQSAFAHVDVLLVIVGPNWLGVEGEHIRIKDTEDLVRIEVETALSRGITTIPVLVGRASMPSSSQLPDSLRAFPNCNAAEVDGGLDFHPHLDRLIQAIDTFFPSNLPNGTLKESTILTDRIAVRDRNSRLASYVTASIVLLILIHHVLINLLDVNTLYLRVASFVVPFGFSVLYFRSTPHTALFALLVSTFVGVLSVAGMMLSTALFSGQPLLPETRFEWRELTEYMIIIVCAFFFGRAVANFVATSRIPLR
jgi:hypothetical protein